jgi:hypothetical protein
VLEARGVVAFVEVFEDAGEDFGLFGRQVDAFAWGCDVWVGLGRGAGGLGGAVRGEEGGCAEDGLVRGEEALLRAHAEDYDGGGGGSGWASGGDVS